MKHLMLVTLCLAVLGCRSHPQPIEQSVVAKPALPDCPAPDSAYFFFPDNTFQNPGGARRFGEATRLRHSNLLREMDEPSMSCGDVPFESYRIVWLPTTLGDDPRVAIRVSLDHDGGSLTATTLKQERPTRLSPEPVHTTRRLTNAESSRVRADLDRLNFWSQPTYRPRMGKDGETWIIEGQRGGRYHATERWNPQSTAEWFPESDAYVATGLTLLDLAGLNFVTLEE